MKQNLIVFNNDLFEVAVKLDNGEYLFDAERVARSLGFTQIKNGVEYIRWETINKYLGKTFSQHLGKGDFIPESAVYKLAFKASNEVAEKFQDWLAIEVLPEIRQTGGYIPTFEDDADEDIMARALLIAQNKIQLKNKVIAEKDALILELEPKAEQYDSLMSSDRCIDIGQLAKILNIRDGKKVLGRNKLFALLKAKGILKENNEPYQQFINAGYFNVIVTKEGFTKTLVTPKGIDYLSKLLLAHNLS